MSYKTKSSVADLTVGTIIVGKWHKNRYTIVGKLGSGARGSVYLVRAQQELLALKVGYDPFGVVSEVNVLKQLAKVQGQSLGPYFIEMDDVLINGHSYPFYVMEYLDGEPLIPFIQKRGDDWLGILIIQLLSALEKLHQKGWVFGDLKPDNLIITGPAPKIRWLDMGGLTRIGQSIKEYTEFFDRGYWGLGSRKAEPSYDLFSVSMILMNCAYPKRFKKEMDSKAQLETKVLQSDRLKRYGSVIIQALHGNFDNAYQMRTMIVRQLTNPTSIQQRGSRVRLPHKQGKRKRVRWLVVGIFIVLFLFLLIDLNRVWS